MGPQWTAQGGYAVNGGFRLSSTPHPLPSWSQLPPGDRVPAVPPRKVGGVEHLPNRVAKENQIGGVNTEIRGTLLGTWENRKY